MKTSDLVRELCKKQHISLAELSRRIGQTPQNLNKKLKRDTLSVDELKQIAGWILTWDLCCRMALK